jgi:uncharacterized repeat protein (TIGR03803 family)
LTLTLALIHIMPTVGAAQTFSVIHTFSGGGDGGVPDAGLIVDGAGNLYGATAVGGRSEPSCNYAGASGCGIIFKLAKKNSTWPLTPLYSFTGGSDGAGPLARVTFGPDGRLYGTARNGGDPGCTSSDTPGCGVVFRLQPAVTFCRSVSCPWTETVLYSFTGGSDGAQPESAVVFDQSGNIYGTTPDGGLTNCFGSGCGVVYELIPSQGNWTESVLYSFTGGTDGGEPFSEVLLDRSGNIYGTTPGFGIPNCFCGTVFELSPTGSGWTLSTLYSFTGMTDGSDPEAGLIFDSSGSLYGSTWVGGTNTGGVAFKLTPSNGGWQYGAVYGFSGTNRGGPLSHLIFDSAGNLYGTTYGDGAYGYGAAFKLTPSNGGWSYTSLHDFTNGSDGAFPWGGLVFGPDGNLYGTAAGGAIPGCGAPVGSSSTFGCGVVYEISLN